VIISKDLEFQEWIATKYEAAISIDKRDIESLRKLIEESDYDKLLSQLYINREKYSLKKQTKRLLSFYQEILDTGKPA